MKNSRWEITLLQHFEGIVLGSSCFLCCWLGIQSQIHFLILCPQSLYSSTPLPSSPRSWHLFASVSCTVTMACLGVSLLILFLGTWRTFSIWELKSLSSSKVFCNVLWVTASPKCSLFSLSRTVFQILTPPGLFSNLIYSPIFSISSSSQIS